MQTLTEKIISNYIEKKSHADLVSQGSAYWIEPEHIMSHDNSAAIIKKFNDFNIKKVINKKQPVIALDHNIQDKSIQNVKKYSRIEQFSKKISIESRINNTKPIYFHDTHNISLEVDEV